MARRASRGPMKGTSGRATGSDDWIAEQQGRRVSGLGYKRRKAGPEDWAAAPQKESSSHRVRGLGSKAAKGPRPF